MYHHLENPARVEYDLMNIMVTVIIVYTCAMPSSVVRDMGSYNAG